MCLVTRKSTSVEVAMDDLDNKVDIWEHQNLQEEVWELQRALEKLREEFEKLKNSVIGDGK